VTSKSLEPTYDLQAVVDLTDFSWFCSDGPRQWVCWDFHEMRLIPTYYTMSSPYTKSWILESSLDGEEWTEIDSRPDLMAPGDWEASFPVPKTVECRFIRITQTGKDFRGEDRLWIHVFELFGTLFERGEIRDRQSERK
jgi:hypothetical protein